MMKPNKSRKMGYGKLPTKLQNVDFFFFLMIDQFFQQCVVRANKTNKTCRPEIVKSLRQD